MNSTNNVCFKEDRYLSINAKVFFLQDMIDSHSLCALMKSAKDEKDFLTGNHAVTTPWRGTSSHSDNEIQHQ